MAQQNLTVEYRSLASLRFDPQNPRLHSKRQIRQIARSIEAFGFNVPALIDADGQLIAGHGRTLAAQLLGMTSIPTITVEHLTEPEIRAFVIADNRLTENATWNDRLLAEQFEALSTLDLKFTIDVTGFEVSQIDMMIEGLTPASRKNDPADAIPDSFLKPQVSRSGDIWILDRHRVTCGDSRADSSYQSLMKGNQADMVFTDPPYNDPIDRYVCGFGKIHHPEFAEASGEMNEEEFANFLTDSLRPLCHHLGWRDVAPSLTA